jgi:hypothetical protein
MYRPSQLLVSYGFRADDARHLHQQRCARLFEIELEDSLELSEVDRSWAHLQTALCVSTAQP